MFLVFLHFVACYFVDIHKSQEMPNVSARNAETENYEYAIIQNVYGMAADEQPAARQKVIARWTERQMTTSFIPLSLLLLLIAGCRPDLVVEKISYDSKAGTVTATIKNIGHADAPGFLVYFNADEDSGSESNGPQVSRFVRGLANDQSVTLPPAEFAPLAKPENNFLRRVYQVTVIIDPENTAKESKEGNNDKSIPCRFSRHEG